MNWSGRFSEKALCLDATRPLRFERSWDSLILDLVRTGQYIREPKVQLDSKLFGETILYKWKPKAGIYDTTRVRGTGKLDIEILESLQPLLPSAVVLADHVEATEGEWTVDPTDLVRSIWPGGFGGLRYADEIGAFPFLELPPIPDLWWMNVQGSVTATVPPTRDGENDLLTIVLELDVSSTIPPQEWTVLDHLGTAWKNLIEWVDFEGDGIAWTWKGTGVLCWSKAHRRMVSLNLEGKVLVKYDVTARFNPFQPERHSKHKLHLREEWRGTTSVQLRERE